MNFIIKRYKLILLIVIMIIFIIGDYFKLNFLVQGIGLLTIVCIYIYITKSALSNLCDCLYYLAIIAPVIGIGLSRIINSSKYSLHFPFSDYIYYVIVYFFIWLLIVRFGELKTVKLATLIIAQFLTALFLIINIILYLIPIQSFNNFTYSCGTNLIEVNKLYGYDSRKIVEIALQILLYPPLVNALLTYIIAELRQYKIEK